VQAKASFDDIYDRPDPRAYFRSLAGLEYQTPEHARVVFAFLTDLQRRRTTRATVLDLCCSYGINAALLNHGLTLRELYARYEAPDLDELSTDELVAADRDFYAGRRRSDPVPVVGLDAAANAVAYAARVGLLAAGRAENLETAEPSADLVRDLADVGLLTVTGGISYITERTFDRVLARLERAPWVAAFVLRWVDMDPIAAVLDRHGLSLELLEGRTFRQRRFADEGERDYTFGQLEALGLDPGEVETDGYHHTCLYLARPRADAEAQPVKELLGGMIP
jgi:hypothetical protein